MFVLEKRSGVLNKIARIDFVDGLIIEKYIGDELLPVNIEVNVKGGYERWIKEMVC
jgi:hypothetical protein